MQVTMSHTRNPDVDGGYWEQVKREGKQVQTVTDFAAASSACRQYINRNKLGGGNWTGGQIVINKQTVARVSFNGRIWDMQGNEIA